MIAVCLVLLAPLVVLAVRQAWAFEGQRREEEAMRTRCRRPLA